jgi:hypothetical protein
VAGGDRYRIRIAIDGRAGSKYVLLFRWTLRKAKRDKAANPELNAATSFGPLDFSGLEPHFRGFSQNMRVAVLIAQNQQSDTEAGMERLSRRESQE